MITLQSLFIILVILLLCYLVVDSLLTRSVWVKGATPRVVRLYNARIDIDQAS